MSPGVAQALSANLLWGLFPLYWRLLDGVPVLHIFWHRVIWSAVFLLLAVAWLRRLHRLRAFATAGWGEWLGSIGGAAFIAVNWGLYIWAVDTEQVVAASLGYFLYPLIAVALGALLFGERLRRGQWWALMLAVAGVGVQLAMAGELPWLSLALASSFGAYGALRKRLRTDALSGQTIEALCLSIPALWVLGRGDAWLAGEGALQDALLIGGGLVTAVPLLLFVSASRWLPLQTTGMLFYLTPVVQFLVGAVWFGESISVGRWLSIALIWLAVTVFTIESLRHRRGPEKGVSNRV